MLKILQTSVGNNSNIHAQSFVVNLDKAQSEQYLIVLMSSSSKDVASDFNLKFKKITDKLTATKFSPEEVISEISLFINPNFNKGIPINVLLSWVEDNKVILKKWGSSKAFILRDNKLINLSGRLKNGELLSGPINAHDTLLFFDNLLTKSETLQKDTIFTDSQFKKFVLNQNELTRDYKRHLLKINEFDQLVMISISQVFSDSKLNTSGKMTLNNQKFKALKFFNKFNPLFVNLSVLLRKQFQKLRWFLRKNPKLGKYLILVSLATFVLLSVAGWNIKSNWQINSQYNMYYSQALDNFNSAKKLQSNNLIQSKIDINQSVELINKALMIKSKSSKALDLNQKIQSLKDDIFKIYRVSDFSIYLSLDLLKTDFKSSRLSYYGDYLLLLSDTDQTLALLNLTQKSNQLLAGQYKIGDAQFGEVYNDNTFVFSKNRGVMQVDPITTKVVTAVPQDIFWGDIADIAIFDNNIYLLDTLNNKIHKYTASSQGYSVRQDYLTGGTDDSLASAKRLKVDGYIWVLDSDGEILKFAEGEKDYFSLEEVSPTLKSATAFYLSDQSENIYIIDSENSRMVAFNKNGKYISQYVGEKFKDVKDLAVDETGKTAYLLTGDKIYTVKLK